MRRKLPAAFVVGVAITVIVIAASVAAPLLPLAPFDAMDIHARLVGPSRLHWLGTDEFGRDVLSRLLNGGRLSLLLGFGATAVTLFLGLPFGLAAAYLRGAVDETIMRTVDILMSIPPIMMGLLVLGMTSPNVFRTAAAVGIVYTPFMVRLTRGVALAVAQQNFIDAARTRGERLWYILGAEILPNVLPPVVVEATLRVSFAILLGAALSFLGLGVQPPSSDWGLMIAEARPFIESAPWVVLAPGVALGMTAIGVSLMGDGIREMLDPRLARFVRLSEPILSVRDLEVRYGQGDSSSAVVRSVSFEICKGRTLGLVGESGSGKSTIALSIMTLLPKAGFVSGGSMVFDGIDLGRLSAMERRALRGGRVGMVFQDPFLSLNPAFTVGTQVAEAITRHTRLGRRAALARTIELLGEVQLARPDELIHAYPFQLSGGMCQRVMIATALSCKPDLLILDEPTTALDVTVEAQILDLLADLRRRRGLSILLISHNLGVVRQFCDDAAVLYAGEVVEQAPVDVLFRRPAHPYTKGLLAALPRLSAPRARLSSIAGRVPSPDERPAGCIFAPRCAFAEERCLAEQQTLLSLSAGQCVRCWKAADLIGTDWPVTPRAARQRADAPSGVLIDIANLSKSFRLGRTGRLRFGDAGLLPFRWERRRVDALCNISLQLRRGQALGIVGESGSGKSNSRALHRAAHPTGFWNNRIPAGRESRTAAVRKP